MSSAPQGRRVVRVFPDYGAEWPLWENGTDDYNIGPADLDLSPGLTARLRAWNDFWEHHFRPESGWDDESNAAQWARDGKEIVAALRTEVYWSAEIRYEPWQAGGS